MFFYGALNVIYKEKYGKEVNAFLNFKITSINSFKNIKGFRVTDLIPYELVEGAEYEKDIKVYNFIGPIADRYNKIINLLPNMVGGIPNPTLYTTQITKQEYEALIDIPNIII